MLALLCLGFAASFIHDDRQQKNWFGKYIAQADAFVVKITVPPQEKEKTWKLTVSIDGVIEDDTLKPLTGKAFVYVYKSGNRFRANVGDLFIVPPAWQAIKNPGNPHEFDYANYCKRNQFFYQQFLSEKDLEKIKEGNLHETSWATRTHIWAMQQLAAHVKDKSTLGLLQAMLLGDEINFSDEDRQRYVDTGIIHIVAISGGHIAFLMWLITAALFWIKKKKHQWIKMAVAIPVVIFYVLVAGAPPSAIRAAVVFSLLAVSVILSSRNNPLNTLLAATFGILLINPSLLFAVGFQLSVIAVLSLLVFYKRIYAWYFPSNKSIKFLWSAVAASLAAEILVAPLVVFYFHLLPASFLVANVVAALLMAVVMILGLMIIIFTKWVVAANALGCLTSFIVAHFHRVIDFIRLFNPPAFKYLHLSLIELLLCYFLIASLAVLIIRKTKPAIYCSLFSACLLLFSFNLKAWKTLHQERFIIYNVSKHALAEYVCGNHYSIVSESEYTVSEKKIDYATRENHIATRAWKQRKITQQALVQFQQQTILFLKNPLQNDTAFLVPIDFLVVEYPIRKFEATKLQQLFHFKKLIVTGNQRRKQLQTWKDSCAKHNMDAHFTMLDGAFAINPLQ